MARFLLLSATMGGGHLQISRELARRLEGDGHTAVVLDMLEVMPPPTGRMLGWVYPFLVNRTPWLYQRVYETFFLAEQQSGERAGIPVHLALPGLRRFVEDFGPDLAVATYPLCSLALGELRRREQLHCPAVTVVTTFSVNNLWLHPGVDAELCISPEAAADTSRRTGRVAGVSGPIVRPGFVGDADGSAFRRRHGIPDDARVALVTTGSMGLVGDADAAAQAIAGHDGWLPVVLCGRSQDVRDRVASIPGAVALDWVEDMPAAMAGADVLVDNNCGMSAKEALAAGLPIVTFRPISGHGRDDAAALERLGLTDVVEDPRRLLQVIEELVEDEARYKERAARGKELFVADAAALVERVADGHPAPASR
jgi:UDP-N-acetylglucosamine:LPS N-acetylglucosamine transferase